MSCVPSEGHFRPLLPLARALAERGHDVAFAAAADWLPRAEEQGFELVAAGVSEQGARARLAELRVELAQLPPETRRERAFTSIFALTYAPQKLPGLIEGARSWGAEAIVYDSGDLAAPIAAAALGLPSVNHSFGAMVPLAALRRAAEAIAPLWRGEGLEAPPYAGAFAELYVDLAPRSFAWEKPPGERVSLRPASATRGHAPTWLRGLARPLVYVTMGTIFNEAALLRALVEGLGDEVSAVVTMGRGGDPASLGPVPPRVRVESFVPQADVLPFCDAVVCHGGSGSTLGALAYGLPLVLAPRGADQFDNAARCAAAGAAVVVGPGEPTADAVRKAVKQVLDDPSFAAAARRVAAEIEEMGSPEEAAAAVEGYVVRSRR